MSRRRLTCPCGHSWDDPGDGPIPDDLRTICPACAGGSGSAGEDSGATVHQSPVQAAASALRSAPSPSFVIPGYEILGEINRGGMGMIFKARQFGLNRLVALKVLTPARLENPEALRRFRREVEAAARVNHPNIVTVYETKLDGPWPYLAMEYVPGIDLSRLVKETGPPAVADACFYVQQAAVGLQAAFEHGLVHRDIKPANLMVTPNPLEQAAGKTGRLPKVKILDMGLARVIDSEHGPEHAELTRDGVFLGTPDFVAPEQAEDSRAADIRSDLYSLGGTLYYLLTGEIPFPGSSVVQKLRRQMTEPPPSAMARRPEVGPDLDAVVRRLMARNPAERYQTPAELIEALDRLRHGLPVGGAAGPATVARALVGTAGGFGTTGTGSGLSQSSSGHLPLGPVQVRAHDGGVNTLAVGTDCQVLVTGGLDGAIRVWNPSKMKETRVITNDVGAVEQVAIAPGGKWAASCSVRLTTTEMGVQIWDLATGAERRRLRGPGENIRCVAIAPDGRGVAAGTADGTAWVWSFEGGTPRPLCLLGHSGQVTGVCYVSPDSLLTAGTDGTVRQWALPAGTPKGTLPGTIGPITALAFAAKRVAIAGKTLAVRVRNGPFQRFDGHSGTVECAAFSTDGRLVASGGSDGTVRVWQAEEGNLLSTFTGHAGAVRAVGFGPDGGVVYSAGSDGTLRRWPITV